MVAPWLVGLWPVWLRVLSVWAVLVGVVVALAAAFPVEAVARPPGPPDRLARGARAALVPRELPVRLATLGLMAACPLPRALRRLLLAQLAVDLPQLVAVRLVAVLLQAVRPPRQARLV